MNVWIMQEDTECGGQDHQVADNPRERVCAKPTLRALMRQGLERR